MNRQTLLEHRLHFLSLYRGRRESLPGLELIYSDQAEFDIAYLLAPEALERVPAGFQIFLPEWIDAATETLSGAGWVESGAMIYMTFEENALAGKFHDTLSVERAVSEAQIDEFSDVQARGFCNSEEEYREWHPWLLEKNREHLPDAAQIFYLGRLGAIAASISLALYHGGVLGIYAVATLPEHRGKGLSGAILRTAIDDARKQGVREVTLQVMAGAYAEGFYRRLGFREQFRCRIFKKTA